jgi:hypothetical protein
MVKSKKKFFSKKIDELDFFEIPVFLSVLYTLFEKKIALSKPLTDR